MTDKWQPPGWATLPKVPTVSLEVRRAGQVIRTHSLAQRKSFVLGRQAGLADILVEDEGVSRQHAALVHRDGALYVIDLKSLAGVTVNGHKCKPLEATPLKEGSEMALGETPLRYVVKGLAAPPPSAPSTAPPTAPQPAAPRPSAGTAAAPPGWQPPSWAVPPSVPVVMHLEEKGAKVQSLDLSRHSSYVLGRSAATAKIVVPDDTVSRQHAAIVHALRGEGGAPSVHIVDLGSTVGTFLDRGRGWERLPTNTPALLFPGCRVRLGDCATRIVYPPPAQPREPPAAAPPPPPPTTTAAAPADDGTPRFSSLLSSTLLTADDGAEEREERLAIGPTARPSTGPLAVAGAPGNSNGDAVEGEEGEEGAAGGAMSDGEAEAPLPLKNADFRNALLPFLAKAPEEARSDGGADKAKERKRKKRRKDDDSESDGEPAPPVILSKDDPAGGLILRKEKKAVAKPKKASSMKIKF